MRIYTKSNEIELLCVDGLFLVCDSNAYTIDSGGSKFILESVTTSESGRVFNSLCNTDNSKVFKDYNHNI